MEEEKYVHGQMNIDDQQMTWNGFLIGTAWSSLILVLGILHATLTIALGVHWMVSLLLSFIVGLGGGTALGLGTKWIATLIGLAALAVVIQFVIWML